MKILYASVLYPTKSFNQFAKDFFNSVSNQTTKNFDLLLFLDCVNLDNITPYINKISQEIIIKSQDKFLLSPSSIRSSIINFAHNSKYDLLIFADFDETVESNLIEEHLKCYNEYGFSFNDFMAVDKNLNPNTKHSFFSNKNLPLDTLQPKNLLDKNFIGLGSSAINPQLPIFKNYLDSSKILAFDWFLFTYILLQGYSGKYIKNTYAHYRQHDQSYIGIGHPLTSKTLHLGIEVKSAHYKFFSNFDSIYQEKYQQILEIKKYIQSKEKNYVRIVNENFNPLELCWWENIKTLQELSEWI